MLRLFAQSLLLFLSFPKEIRNVRRDRRLVCEAFGAPLLQRPLMAGVKGNDIPDNSNRLRVEGLDLAKEGKADRMSLASVPPKQTGGGNTQHGHSSGQVQEQRRSLYIFLRENSLAEGRISGGKSKGSKSKGKVAYEGTNKWVYTNGYDYEYGYGRNDAYGYGRGRGKRKGNIVDCNKRGSQAPKVEPTNQPTRASSPTLYPTVSRSQAPEEPMVSPTSNPTRTLVTVPPFLPTGAATFGAATYGPTSAPVPTPPVVVPVPEPTLPSRPTQAPSIVRPTPDTTAAPTGAPPIPSTPPTSAPVIDQTVNPTDAPTQNSTLPQQAPTLSPTLEPARRFRILDFYMEYNLNGQSDTEPEQPTPDDINNLLVATEEFYLTIFQQEYEDDPEVTVEAIDLIVLEDRFEQFLALDPFFASEGVIMDLYVEYRPTIQFSEESERIPRIPELQSIMSASTFEFQRYILDYVRPAGAVFAGTTHVGFMVIEDSEALTVTPVEGIALSVAMTAFTVTAFFLCFVVGSTVCFGIRRFDHLFSMWGSEEDEEDEEDEFDAIDCVRKLNS